MAYKPYPDSARGLNELESKWVRVITESHPPKIRSVIRTVARGSYIQLTAWYIEKETGLRVIKYKMTHARKGTVQGQYPRSILAEFCGKPTIHPSDLGPHIYEEHYETIVEDCHLYITYIIDSKSTGRYYEGI